MAAKRPHVDDSSSDNESEKPVTKKAKTAAGAVAIAKTQNKIPAKSAAPAKQIKKPSKPASDDDEEDDDGEVDDDAEVQDSEDDDEGEVSDSSEGLDPSNIVTGPRKSTFYASGRGATKDDEGEETENPIDALPGLDFGDATIAEMLINNRVDDDGIVFTNFDWRDPHASVLNPPKKKKKTVKDKAGPAESADGGDESAQDQTSAPVVFDPNVPEELAPDLPFEKILWLRVFISLTLQKSEPEATCAVDISTYCEMLRELFRHCRLLAKIPHQKHEEGEDPAGNFTVTQIKKALGAVLKANDPPPTDPNKKPPPRSPRIIRMSETAKTAAGLTLTTGEVIRGVRCLFPTEWDVSSPEGVYVGRFLNISRAALVMRNFCFRGAIVNLPCDKALYDACLLPIIEELKLQARQTARALFTLTRISSHLLTTQIPVSAFDSIKKRDAAAAKASKRPPTKKTIKAEEDSDDDEEEKKKPAPKPKVAPKGKAPAPKDDDEDDDSDEEEKKPVIPKPKPKIPVKPKAPQSEEYESDDEEPPAKPKTPVVAAKPKPKAAPAPAKGEASEYESEE